MIAPHCFDMPVLCLCHAWGKLSTPYQVLCFSFKSSALTSVNSALGSVSTVLWAVFVQCFGQALINHDCPSDYTFCLVRAFSHLCVGVRRCDQAIVMVMVLSHNTQHTPNTQ
jgi:hypothetical protein